MKINLQLLEEDWADAANNREKKTLKKINLLMKEINRLENILDDFLRFARGYRLKPVDRDVNAILGEVLEFVMPEAESHGIRILSLLEPGVGKYPLDVNHFKQALLNIIVNGQQAMENGGDLIVRSHREGKQISIDITDTGAGIAPENLEKIFNVYWSNKKGGTGLGLAFTRRIIEEHGGDILVQSEPNVGTQVTIQLPASPSANG